MAIEYDSYESGIDSGSGCIIDVPSNTQDGDLLILALNNDNATLMSPSGWTEIEYLRYVSSSDSGMWYRVADTEPSSYNFGSSSNQAGIIALFTESSSGTWSISDSGSSNQSPSSSSLTVSGVTAASGDALVLHWGSDDTISVTTSPTDMTEIAVISPASSQVGMWYEENASAQDYSKSLSLSGGNNGMALAAIHFVSSGGSILPSNVNDGFSISDVSGRSAILSAAAVESVNFQDTDQNLALFLSQISETININDAASALNKIIGLVSDGIGVDDGAVVRADLAAASVDSVQFAESLLVQLQARAVANELINLADSVSSDEFQVLQAFVTEALEFSDSVSSLVGMFAYAAESIQISDQGVATATFNLAAADVVQFAEAVGTIAALRASIADGINISATAMEVSTLPNGKVSVSFSLKSPGAAFDIKIPGIDMDMKSATIVFNIK